MHNHPLHKENKILVKFDTDTRRAVIENPHLKILDVLTGMYANTKWYIVQFIAKVFLGKGMEYIPKIKNIRMNILRDNRSNTDARSATLSFTAEAKKYDQSMPYKVES